MHVQIRFEICPFTGWFSTAAGETCGERQEISGVSGRVRVWNPAANVTLPFDPAGEVSWIVTTVFILRTFEMPEPL